MTVNDINAVRRKFQESGITYQVVKNTLMARACADTPYAGVAELLKGTPTGVVLGGEDAVSAALCGQNCIAKPLGKRHGDSII